MRIESKVRAFIEKQHLLAPGDRVLVAVSGGPDSVALLRLLYDMRDDFDLELAVAHLEHGIRGKEGWKDAQFVTEMAEDFGLPLSLKSINLPRMRSAAGKGNLEAMARDARYRFFADVAREFGLTKVATAHTQDDQAETILMWMLRGAGRKGLGGMSPLRRLHAADDRVTNGLTIVRPLLNVSKAEILGFLKQKHLTYRRDRTNQDPKLLRNWIRLKLMPQLKQRIDPNLPLRLSQEAALIRDEEVFLERLARSELDKIRGPRGVSRESLLKQDKAIQRLIARLWIEETRGHLRGIDFAHVEELLKLISDPAPQGRLAIPGGWELVREYETLRLEKRSRNQKRLCYSYNFQIGTDLDVREAGMTIHSECISPPLPRLPGTSLEAVFDLASLSQPLTVRNFRHGDRYRPLGMVGHKKVKDLFIEKKVPLAVRAALPLLSMGNEILWIPGYGRSEIGRINAQTTSMLHLEAVPFRG